MSKTIKIAVSKEDTNALQRANIELNTYTENLQFMLNNPEKGYSSEMVDEYTKKKIDSELEFERLKAEAARKYIPAELFGNHQYEWNIDYATSKMSIEVFCDCGIEVLNKLGL